MRSLLGLHPLLVATCLCIVSGCGVEPNPVPTRTPAPAQEPRPPIEQQGATPPLDEQAEPLGVLTTQGSDGAVRLSPLVGTLSHEALDWDDYDVIRGFSNTDQTVRWRARWIRPGEYHVVVISTATGPTAEARIRVVLEPKESGVLQRVEATLPLTEEPTEVTRTSVGIVKIEQPGEATVTVRMIGLPLVGTFGLAGIDLEPVTMPEAGFSETGSPATRFVIPRSPTDEP